jgi:hypothetical protein
LSVLESKVEDAEQGLGETDPEQFAKLVEAEIRE